MSLYAGINGTRKEITSLYVGINGTPKEITSLYAGENGQCKLINDAKAEPGQTVFTASGNFTVPKGVKEIEVFLVGGGGGGFSGAAGGGGYTTTGKITVTPNGIIPITVGAGSSSGTGGVSTIYETSANGGKSGHTDGGYYCGGDGGSGGGTSAFSGSIGWGGSDGGNGRLGLADYSYTWSTDVWYDFQWVGDGWVSGWYTEYRTSYTYARSGGKGQGSTTRAFGESNGTLYSNGGSSHGGAPTANTGNGGNSSGGSSGIATIRWGY